MQFHFEKFERIKKFVIELSQMASIVLWQRPDALSHNQIVALELLHS